MKKSSINFLEASCMLVERFSTRRLRSSLGFAVSTLCLGSALLPLRVAAVTISSTVAEDNGATTNATDVGNTTPDQNQDVYDDPNNHPGVLTTGTGYSFGSSYTTLTQITNLSITLTALNGSSASAAQETAAGNASTTDDFDYNHLVLYLGGTFNSATGLVGGTEVLQADGTPLYLNGLLGNDLQSTITLSNVPISMATGSAILSTLQMNGGVIAAYVGTDNPDDTSPTEGDVPVGAVGNGPAEIFLGNNGDPLVANAMTTLSLSGVPEPGVMTSLLSAGGVLLLVNRARSRRARAASA